MSMAAGEYVSVHSQADTEKADLAKERAELRDEPEAELRELTGIYIKRGLQPLLARQVAEQLTARDALAAHARDELGITEALSPRPVQAALSSAASFAAGASLPLALVLLFDARHLAPAVSLGSLLFLALLGVIAARIGGASPVRGAMRIAIAGVFAFAVTAGIGKLFGTVV
jgi:VIT1/CCC1 family predicted Fe2+/Mn2+ transporter